MLIHTCRLFQTASASIAVDLSTTSTTYANLLTITMATGANPVLLHFTCSPNNSSSYGWTEYQLIVNGTITRGLAVRATSATNGDSGALVYKTAVQSVGSHTFTIQWRVGASGGSAFIRPVTMVGEHASFVAAEVSV